jgi:hypothetical protein
VCKKWSNGRAGGRVNTEVEGLDHGVYVEDRAGFALAPGAWTCGQLDRWSKRGDILQ